MKTDSLKLIYLCIAGSLLTCRLFAAGLQQSSRDLPAYFQYLESIAHQPPAQQSTSLDSFIAQNPELPQPYFKCIELALLQNRLDSLQNALEQNTAPATGRQNRFWALARIHDLQGKTKVALERYQQAIQSDTVPLQLWIDYLAFAYKQFPLTDWSAERPAGTADERNLLRGLHSHFIGQHKLAADQFAALPRAITAQPSFDYLWGSCFFDAGRYKQADSLWQAGLHRARAFGDRQTEAQLLTSLAYAASQDYATIDRAQEYYLQAEQIARSIDDAYRLQIALGSHAVIRAEPSEAITGFRHAIDIAVQLRQFEDAAQWYMGLAQTYFFAERFALALQTYSAGEAVARRAGDPTIYVQMLRDKGDLYYDLHQDSLARKTYQDVLDLARQLRMPQQEKSTRARLADDLLETGDFSQARAAYIDYINFLSDPAEFPARAYWQSRVAESFKREGQMDRARQWIEQAVATARSGSDDFYENWLLLELAKLELAENKPEAAIESAQSIRDYAVEQAYNELLWQVELLRSKAYHALGEVRMRLSALQNAASAIEQTRSNLTVDQLKISYFSEAQQVYRQLVAGYFQQYTQHPSPTLRDTLFHYVQLTRGRTLNEFGSSANPVSRDSSYFEMVAGLRSVQRQLRDHPEQRQDLQSAFEAARYALLTRRLRLSAHSDSAITNSHIPTLGEAMVAMADLETALLIYHLDPEASFVFVVTGDRAGLIRVDLHPDSLQFEVNTLISPFYQVEAASIDSVIFRADLAHRLYLQLVAPVEHELQGRLPDKVLIVPDIALMQLPFEMLLTAPPAKARYTPTEQSDYGNAFLLHRRTISYSPSLAILQAKPQAGTMKPGIAIFANPFGANGHNSNLRSMRGWRFDALPYAEEEARRIGALFDDPDIYLRDQATKEAFRDQVGRAPILHLATHAFADPSFDAFSGLVLATTADSSDDGLLMGYEIAELNLRADFVALSACETGLGQLVSGEGVLGLPRLFLGAGAQSVLMTRWVIDDAFASALLPEFYRNYLQNSNSKAEALARAKRQLMQTTGEQTSRYAQHPFYWASYSLYGHPGRGVFTPKSNFVRNISLAAVMLGILYALLWHNRKHRKKK